MQPVIISDTFYQFAQPIIEKLGNPALFCNLLEIDDNNMIISHRMRQDNQKEKVVAACKDLKFQVVAIGDSYNDTVMLARADKGILFRAPEKISKEFPQFILVHEYDELKKYILE